NTPFVGRNFNVTRAGIHADGLLKDEEIYNIFDTKKILKRRPQVAIGKHSGLAGIAYWINTFFRLEEKGMAIDKKAELVVKMKEQIEKEYEAGRTTMMSDEELVSMIKRFDPKLYKKIANI